MPSRILSAREKGTNANERKNAKGTWQTEKITGGNAITLGSSVNSVTTLFKQKTPKNKKYLLWISGLNCCVCGRFPLSDYHHVPEDGHGGKGMKCSDYRTIPLCFRHHREAHDTGKKTFAIKYGLDYNSIIEQLNETWRILTMEAE